MIFITVGSMLPFDRLVRSMDDWAKCHPEQDTFAQIGKGAYLPVNMRWARTLSPVEFRATVASSNVVIAHAGMGTFFLCMEMLKPVVMLPRLASKNEVTTDHQLSTLRWIGQKPGVYVASSDKELPGAIDAALRGHRSESSKFSRYAPDTFIRKIRKVLVE